jgi:hypothetical protein
VPGSSGIPYLSSDERRLLLRIKQFGSASVFKPHLDLAVARLSATGFIYGEWIEDNTMLLWLTPEGEKLVGALGHT